MSPIDGTRPKQPRPALLKGQTSAFHLNEDVHKIQDNGGKAKLVLKDAVIRVAGTLSLSVARLMVVKKNHSEASLSDSKSHGLILKDVLAAAIKAMRRLQGIERSTKPSGYQLSEEAWSILLDIAHEVMAPMKGHSSLSLWEATRAYSWIQRASSQPGEWIPRPKGPHERCLKDGPKVKPGAWRRYMRLALAAYGNTGMKLCGILPKKKGWNHYDSCEFLTGVPRADHVIDAVWRPSLFGAIYRPAHFLVVDHANKQVVLSIRGSYSFQDVMVDLVCRTVPFDFEHDAIVETHGGASTNTLAGVFSSDDASNSDDEYFDMKARQASSRKQDRDDLDGLLNRSNSDGGPLVVCKGETHYGFLKAAQLMDEQLKETVVETMEKHPGYGLALVGHSMGSAIAAILNLLWIHHPILRSARTYGAAMPAVFDVQLASSPLALRCIRSLVLGNDYVPRLSLGTIMDTRDAAFFCQTKKVKHDPKDRTIAQFVFDACRKSKDKGPACDVAAPEERTKMLQPIMDRIRAKEQVHQKLYPPGAVWHVERDDGHVQDALLKRNRDFGEIRMVPGMIEVHLPQAYAKACCPLLSIPEIVARTYAKRPDAGASQTVQAGQNSLSPGQQDGDMISQFSCSASLLKDEAKPATATTSNASSSERKSFLKKLICL